MSNEEKTGFAFYESYLDTLNLIPDVTQRMLLMEAICAYGLFGEEMELPYPLDAIFVQLKTSIAASRQRYLNAVNAGRRGAKYGRMGAEYGKLGGRPQKPLTKEQVNEAYTRLQNWELVAKELGISYNTLTRRRKEWNASESDNNPQNPAPKDK